MASSASYWTKRRKIRKRVQAHLDSISQQNVIEDDELSDCSNSLLSDHGENLNEPTSRSPMQSICSDNALSDENDTWYDAECEPCEPQFCEWGCSGDESDCNSSSSDGEWGESKNDSIASFLNDWAMKHNISRVALNELLVYLRIFDKTLPKDSRTLLKTTTDYDIRSIQGGSYHHFGLQSALSKILSKATLTENSVVSLQLSVDGLPIFKSSSTQFWPILCRIVYPFETEPFVTGLYCGSSKPRDISEYLQELVSELKVLETGLSVEGVNFPVRINVSCVICDAPARAYVKQIKPHNAYYGCDKCTQKGEWQGKVIFPALDSPLRTDVQFDELQHPEHHDGVSPLADTSLGMVTNFPVDFMHLVCLGVMRRLIWLWIKGPIANCCRIGRHMVSAISDNLLKFHCFLPREFGRK